ncbi:hypothetical protein AG1IA_06158 [Rhizoctonia solani AG-1 IA]|uniref:Uncharacterized protein n=1 Tax=Thanatephorus cucumeris (strain AG1-IA) TaxID=983506 RepID=L8WSQ1_THACA|nr:hypothetical protein AG1IA_06158 [Rhizoctonia solani AG-1 IA]
MNLLQYRSRTVDISCLEFMPITHVQRACKDGENWYYPRRGPKSRTPFEQLQFDTGDANNVFTVLVPGKIKPHPVHAPSVMPPTNLQKLRVSVVVYDIQALKACKNSQLA